MLRFLTAGESHGPALVGIIEGLPSNFALDIALIDDELKRRQEVQGRGLRMNIEQDKVSVLSGMRAGKTLGSPLTFIIHNVDYVNWKGVMGHSSVSDERRVTAPRPGHADFPGMIKYGFSDARNVLERASARETAMRTAIGAVAKQILAANNITLYSRVISLGELELSAGEPTKVQMMSCRNQPLGFPCSEKIKEAKELLEKCQKEKMSVGGIFEVAVFGLPVGLGTYVQADRRLDGQLAGQLMSIPGVKGLEIGPAFAMATAKIGAAGDSLCFDEQAGYYYEGNANGGLAGGMTTGQPLVVRCAVKPPPTAMPGRTVDIDSKCVVSPARERSDTCIVPAAAIVGEAVVAWVL
ncbi:MAG: chorismate synthase, partial [bacterium]|nr:chorismate synthase [bacterium]